jgi:hypothetical protein
MRPAFVYYVMQEQHYEPMQSAAQRRPAAQGIDAKAQTAHRARRDGAAAAPGRRVRQLIRHLLPA